MSNQKLDNLRRRAGLLEATHVIAAKGEDAVICSIDNACLEMLEAGHLVKVIQPRGLRGCDPDPHPQCGALPDCATPCNPHRTEGP